MNDGIFRVNEIALFRNLPHPFDILNSHECEVVGALQPREVVDLFGGLAFRPVYIVSFNGIDCAAFPENLKKRPQKPDSKDTEFAKVVSWSDCAWSPELEAA